MDYSTFISENEPTIRLAVFLGLFGILGLTEWLRPRRKLTVPKGSRWFTNIAIVIIDSVVVRLIFPAAMVGQKVSEILETSVSLEHGRCQVS